MEKKEQPEAEWSQRAREAGLNQVTLAALAGVSPNSVYRAFAGYWTRGLSGYLCAIIAAWEIMSVEQRQKWTDALANRREPMSENKSKIPLRSTFALIPSETNGVVFIADAAALKIAVNRRARSVTNDAENVVRYLYDRFGDKKIIYRDSERQWEELQHTKGEFTTFAPCPDGVNLPDPSLVDDAIRALESSND